MNVKTINGKKYHVFSLGKKTIYVLNKNMKHFEKPGRNKAYNVDPLGNLYYRPPIVTPKAKTPRKTPRPTPPRSTPRRTPKFVQNNNATRNFRRIVEQSLKK